MGGASGSELYDFVSYFVSFLPLFLPYVLLEAQ